MPNQYDLTAIIEKSLTTQGFSPEQVQAVKSTSNFQRAAGQCEMVQRTYLTLMLNNWLLHSEVDVPSQVRLSLTMAPDVRSWIDDVVLVVLPYLKANPIVLPIRTYASL